MKLLLMADGRVGFAITHWLLTEFRKDLALVVTTAENDIWMASQDAGVAHTVFESDEQVLSLIEKCGVECTMGLLAWWPKIIKEPLLKKPRLGFINTHPSLLPHNRGKHYNFWAIVEKAPFGVSLHIVENGVDSGEVVAQMPIPYGWEDTGESLYKKATEAMVRLFQETYPTLRKLPFSGKKQNLALGSFHKAAEIDAASHIELDKKYQARDLLNLIRARTFSGHPACWFSDAGEEYEVRVEIKRKE